jgi:hypothetical protein
MKTKLYIIAIVVMLVTLACGTTATAVQPTQDIQGEVSKQLTQVAIDNPTAIPPTPVPTATIVPTQVFDEEGYYAKITLWLFNVANDSNTLEKMFSSPTSTIQEVYDTYDDMILYMGKIANEPCPQKMNETVSFWKKAYNELVEGRVDLHNALDNKDQTSINNFAEHLNDAAKYMKMGNDVMHSVNSDLNG